MNAKELKTYLGEDFAKVESVMRTSLKSDIDLLNITNDSILKNGGKMLRPMLSLLISRACSGANINEDSIKYAAAAELLHNATLLHDDVADNSPTRRGKPTVFAMLGSSASVLVGDFWLVQAMENILSGKDSTGRVIRIFSKTLSDLAEGEMLQLQKANSADTTEEDYIRIIYSKTASLFVATALSAAISVNASKEVEQAVEKYAKCLGLAFQIKDDMFDYSDKAEIGKPVGIDLQEQKITIPLLGALSKADSQKEMEIRAMVKDITSNPDNELVIREFVKEQDGLGYAANQLHRYIVEAIEALDILPESKDKQYLIALAKYVGERSL